MKNVKDEDEGNRLKIEEEEEEELRGRKFGYEISLEEFEEKIK